MSTDGTTWSTVYQTTSGAGGVMQIPLAQPVTARWVRMTATQQSNDTPLQVNGFQVYGTSEHPRPPATGWSNWGSQPRAAGALAERRPRRHGAHRVRLGTDHRCLGPAR